MAIRSAADSAFGARTATSLNRMRRGARRARGRRARGILGDHKRDLMLRVAPPRPPLRASGAGAARRVNNLLIVVIPALLTVLRIAARQQLPPVAQPEHGVGIGIAGRVKSGHRFGK